MIDEPINMDSLKFLLTQNIPGHGCSFLTSYHTVTSDTWEKCLVFFPFLYFQPNVSM